MSRWAHPNLLVAAGVADYMATGKMPTSHRCDVETHLPARSTILRYFASFQAWTQAVQRAAQQQGFVANQKGAVPGAALQPKQYACLQCNTVSRALHQARRICDKCREKLKLRKEDGAGVWMNGPFVEGGYRL